MYGQDFYTGQLYFLKKVTLMEMNPMAWGIVLIFGAVLGIGLLGGGITGKATAGAIPVTSGTVLSVIAAVVAIGVLIVAGLKQGK